MGLEVQSTIFKWLQASSLVKDGRRTTDNLIQLPDDVSMKFYDGVYVAALIKNIITNHTDAMSFEKLEAIKENSTPAIRLYNWSILSEMLKKLGLTMEYSQKSRILNLQPAPLQKILTFLHKTPGNVCRSSSSTLQMAPTTASPLQVDLTSLKKKQLSQSTNILQFFVISIAKNFKLSPQHTLNLFLDGNKYLAHLLVKGVKNVYEPVYGLFQDFRVFGEMVVVRLFCTDEKESVTFFMNAVKPALISKDEGVVEACISVLAKLRQTYINNSMSLDIVNNWIKEEGLNTIFFSIKRHPQMFDQLMGLAIEFLGQNLYPFLQPTQKSLLWQSQPQRLLFLPKVLPLLPPTPSFLTTHSLSKPWLVVLQKSLRKPKDPQQHISLLSTGSYLWLHYQQQFESDDNDLVNIFMAFLKNCSLHQQENVFVQAVVVMCQIMEVLGGRKNLYAPVVYKLLVNCFMFSGILHRVQFLAENFQHVLQSIKNLPGSALVEPILKNLQKQPTPSILTLCRTILQQNRINEDQLLQLLEILTSLVFHDVHYGVVAMECIFDHVEVMGEDMVEDYCQKNMKNTLAHFYSVARGMKRKFSELKEDYRRYGQEEGFKNGGSLFSDSVSKGILLGNLCKFYGKCANESQQARFIIEPMLFHTYIRIKNQLKKQEQANLLLPLMRLSGLQDDQLQLRIRQYQDDLKPPRSSTPELSPPRTLQASNKSSLLRSESVAESASKPLDHTTLKPAQSAIKDLQTIKKRVSDQKSLQQKKKQEMDLLQEKKELFRSVINEKRKVEFGVKSIQNMQYKCVYDWGTAKEEDPTKVYGCQVRLLDLSEQESAYVQDVDSVMKKYRKVWRFLFFKYSSFGAKTNKQPGTKPQQKINTSQLWKMLKQYNFLTTNIKKQESHTIVRMINEQMKRRNDLQNLTYLGFEEYILQISYFGFAKYGLLYSTPGARLRMFVKMFRDATENCGGNVGLFQNPEEVYFQETQVIQEFNRRLKDNPQYILPEGYKKIRQTELYYEYQIHPANIRGIPSPHNDILQILDQIISQCPGLGFHLLQPLTYKEQHTIAKPSLFQNLAQKLKDHKKGYLLPKKPLPSTSQQKSRELPPEKSLIQPQRVNRIEFHPLINFSLGIKIGLAGVNIKNRFIADEVAYWVDDMLDAVENGWEKVENKAKRKIENQAVKKRRASLHRIKLQQKNDEIRRRKRAQSVKQQANLNKQLQKQATKEKQQQQKQQEKQLQQKKEQQKKQKQQKYQQAKLTLQQKRKQAQQQYKLKQQQKQKQHQEYKKGVEEYFKKKKSELEEEQKKKKKNREDQAVKDQEQNIKKKDFVKKLHINILKKEEAVLNRVQEVKNLFNQVWANREMQDMFEIYEGPLKMLFDLLIKYEKSKISTTESDQLSFNTLHFFALKFKLVPFMIDKNALNKIFKITGRSNDSVSGVNFNGFKQTLFRIAVRAKQLLNEILKNKKQKSNKKSEQSIEDNIVEQIQGQQKKQSSLKRESSVSPAKKGLTDEYLFDAEGVTPETVEQLIKFLNLPRDKLGMDERYRQVLEEKGSKPKNLLIKELRNCSFQQ